MTDLEDGSIFSVDSTPITVKGNNGGGFVSLFLDASELPTGQNLDVVLSGKWHFADNKITIDSDGNVTYDGNFNSGIPVRLYVNDNDGKNTVRVFLRKGTEFVLTSKQAYVPNSAKGAITGQNLMSETKTGNIAGVIYPRYVSDYPSGKLPRLFIFSEGAVLDDVTVDTSENVMPRIVVVSGDADAGNFHGYILAPLAKFVSNAMPRSILGKVCCGYIKLTEHQDNTVIYVPTDESIEQAAITGVFNDSSSSGSGGAVSLRKTS
jgi:hypothetical protein